MRLKKELAKAEELRTVCEPPTCGDYRWANACGHLKGWIRANVDHVHGFEGCESVRGATACIAVTLRAYMRAEKGRYRVERTFLIDFGAEFGPQLAELKVASERLGEFVSD